MNDFTPVRHQPPPPKSSPPLKEDDKSTDDEIAAIDIAGTEDGILLKADKNKDGELDTEELLNAFDKDGNRKLDMKEINAMASAIERTRTTRRRKDGEGVHPALWSTHQAYVNFQKPLYIIFYLGLIYCHATMYQPDQFNLGQIFQNRLITSTFNNGDNFKTNFKDISSVDSMYRWMHDILLPNIAPQKATAAVARAFKEYTKEDGTNPVSFDGLLEIKSPPILRQVRAADRFLGAGKHQVKETSGISWMSSGEDIVCQPSLVFSASSASITPCDTCQNFTYNITDTKGCGCSTDNVRYLENTGEANWEGEYALYPGTGYVEYLPISDDTTVKDFGGDLNDFVRYRNFCSIQRLSKLRHNAWVDQSTRAVMITFCAEPLTTSTEAGQPGATSDIIGCFRALFEINRYGYIRPHYSFYSAATAVTDNQKRINQLSIMFLMFVIPAVMLIGEGVELAVKRTEYFRNEDLIWNCLDICMFTASLWVGLNYDSTPFDAIDTTAQNDLEMNGVMLKDLANMENVITTYGVVIFLTTMRITHVCAVSDAFKLPVLTLFNALYRSLPFVVFLVMWCIGSSFIGLFLFGSRIRSFSTIYRSMMTVLRLFIGDIDFEEFEGTELSFKGPILLSLLCCMTLYIVFTMFVSIIDAAYTDMTLSLKKERELRELAGGQVDWFGSRLKRSIIKFLVSNYSKLTARTAALRTHKNDPTAKIAPAVAKS